MYSELIYYIMLDWYEYVWYRYIDYIVIQTRSRAITLFIKVIHIMWKSPKLSTKKSKVFHIVWITHIVNKKVSFSIICTKMFIFVHIYSLRKVWKSSHVPPLFKLSENCSKTGVFSKK